MWTLVGMCVLMVGGFFIAREIARELFAPHYLQSSGVRPSRFKPIRVLSPEEAQAMAQDAPSKVWTEGVKPSDVPALPKTSTPKKTTKPAKTTPTPAKTEAPPADAPVDAPATDTTAPPDTPEATPDDTPKEPRPMPGPAGEF
jgi:hypothetical protein